MDTELLPIVPFGKYKGHPITTLLNDIKYLEWCKQQEWFTKYPIVYNICVNQTITSNNIDSNTPDHNKLQNLFLDNKNVEKLLRLIYKKFKYTKNVSYSSAKCEFEGSFNWDVIIDSLSFTKIQCKCNWDEKEDDICDCKYEDNDDYEYALSNIYIELKPLLGDDYPCVLRKMKIQKELTLNNLEKEKQDMLDEVGYVKGKTCVWEYGGRKFKEVKERWDFVNKNSRMFHGEFILLIKEYNSNNTPKDKLIEIFKQSGINVVFTNDVFNNLPSQIITEQRDQLQDITIQQTHQQEKKEKENKLLRQNLLQAEEKIKKLEEEIISLKTQKQSKSIKDYFLPK
jgi:uncharacterized protein (DUF3820 family)